MEDGISLRRFLEAVLQSVVDVEDDDDDAAAVEGAVEGDDVVDDEEEEEEEEVEEALELPIPEEEQEFDLGDNFGWDVLVTLVLLLMLLLLLLLILFELLLMLFTLLPWMRFCFIASDFFV